MVDSSVPSGANAQGRPRQCGRTKRRPLSVQAPLHSRPSGITVGRCRRKTKRRGRDSAVPHLPQLADRLDAELLKLPAGHLADAPDPADRQWIEELLDLARYDDDEAIWLAKVAGDLGDELARSNADRRDQADIATDVLLDLP